MQNQNISFALTSESCSCSWWTKGILSRWRALLTNLEDMDGRHLQSIISKPTKTQEGKWTLYLPGHMLDKRDKRNISSALELSWERLTWWWKVTRWWSDKCHVRTKLMGHWKPVGDALTTWEATGSLPRTAFVWDDSLTTTC